MLHNQKQISVPSKIGGKPVPGYEPMEEFINHLVHDLNITLVIGSDRYPRNYIRSFDDILNLQPLDAAIDRETLYLFFVALWELKQAAKVLDEDLKALDRVRITAIFQRFPTGLLSSQDKDLPAVLKETLRWLKANHSRLNLVPTAV